MVDNEVARVSAKLVLDTTQARRDLRRDMLAAGTASGAEFKKSFLTSTKDLKVNAKIDLSGEKELQAKLDKVSKDKVINVKIKTESVGGVGGLPTRAQGEKAGKRFLDGFSKGVGRALNIGPGLARALVIAAVPAAPLIGAAIGAGIVTAPAFLAIGTGIALQFKDPEVKAAGTALAAHLKTEFVDASSGIKAPLLGAMDSFDKRITASLPTFKRMFDTAGSYLKPLGDAVGQTFQNALPGTAGAITSAQPIVAQIAKTGPELGTAIGSALDTIASHSKDIALGIKVLGDTTAGTVKVVAQAVGVLSSGVPVLNAIDSVISTIGAGTLVWGSAAAFVGIKLGKTLPSAMDKVANSYRNAQFAAKGWERDANGGWKLAGKGADSFSEKVAKAKKEYQNFYAAQRAEHAAQAKINTTPLVKMAAPTSKFPMPGGTALGLFDDQGKAQKLVNETAEITRGQTGFAASLGRTSARMSEAHATSGKLSAGMVLLKGSFSGVKLAGAGLMAAMGGPWGIAIAGIALGIGALIGANAEAAQKTKEHADAALILRDALTANNGVIDDNNRKTAAQQIESTKLFDSFRRFGFTSQMGMYEGALKLGISQKELTDAWIEGGPALQTLIDKAYDAQHAIGDYTDATDKQKQIGIDLHDKLVEQQRALGGATDQQTNLTEATKKTASATSTLGALLSSSSDAFTKRTTDTAARITLLRSVGDSFAGTQKQGSIATGIFVGALVDEGIAALTTKDRVDALRSAGELLNGTNRAAIDATETFNSALGSMTLATDVKATADMAASAAAKAHRDAIKSAKDEVTSASKQLVSAQQAEKKSQLDLIQARKDAVQQLADMKVAQSDLVNSEEGSTIALARARENLAKVTADGTASDLDRQEAILGVRTAEASLTGVQKDRVTQDKEYTKAKKEGINGNPAVVSAAQAQKDALDAVKTASDGVKDAIDKLTEAQKPAASSIAKTTATLDIHTVAGVQNRDMLENLIKSNEDSYYANLANGDSVEEAKGKYDKQATSIENTAVKAGFNRGEVRKLNTEYGKLPDTKNTLLTTQGFDKVYAQLLTAKLIQDNLNSATPHTQAQVAQEIKNELEASTNPMSYQYRSDLSYGGANKAEGGTIRGIGGPTGDKIHIMASDEEYIIKAKSAKSLGEPVLDYINKEGKLPGFAKGGSVKNWLFKFDLSKTTIPDVIGAGAGTYSAPTGTTPGKAYTEAARLNASTKIMLALFETGLVESHFKNLASKRVPESSKYPHEGVAPGDHDSVGFLQQRGNWGSVRSRMNIAESTARFVRKARKLEDEYLTAGGLAQGVQGSKYPGRYDAQKANAQSMLGLAGNGPAKAPSGGGKSFVPGYKNQLSTLRSAGFDFHPNSHQTTGGVHATNSWHYPSKHPPGRAVDLSPPDDKTWGWLAKNYGKTSQELFWASKPVNYQHGNKVGPHDKTNHIHWAYKDGGPVKPTSFDSGGWWKDNMAAIKQSKAPEAVLTQDQWDLIGRLVASNVQGGRGDTSISFGDIHSDVQMGLALTRVQRIVKGAGF